MKYLKKNCHSEHIRFAQYKLREESHVGLYLLARDSLLRCAPFRMTVVLLCIGVFLFIPLLGGVRGGFSFAQQNKIDSLKQALQTATHDTARIKTLNTLAWELKNKGQYEKSLNYSNQGLTLAKKIGFQKGIANSYSKIGNVYEYQGDYLSALENYFNALKISEELGNKSYIATHLGNIGNVYWSQGNYPKALEYYFKALKIDEELGNKNGLARHLGNIGGVYYRQGDYPKALEYYFKGLKIDEELGNKNGIAANLGNIGNVYIDHGDYPKALECYFNALKISEELGNKGYIAATLGNIGLIYDEQGDYPKALEYYFKALKIDEELGNKNGIAIYFGNIGVLYTNQKKYPEAERYLLQALEIDTVIGFLAHIKFSHEELSELYEQTGQYQKAYRHYKAYSIAKDTIYNEEKSKEIGRLEAGFEYDKKLALEQAEHEKQSAVAASESKRQKVVIYAVSGGLMLLIVFFILLFNRFRIIRKQKNIIEEQKQVVDEKNVEITQKNKDITDSIRYAEQIQQAILPPIEEIKKTLTDSFVLFKPKDIVSGDFYFYARVNQYTIIAACDCTGHGVPGAFMSMIGNSLLNEIVNDRSVTDAAEVLNQLRDGVIHAFGEAGATGEAKDGMDMALCIFKRNKDNGIINLQYAGAYNPLYLIREGEIQQIKADKQPVGYHFGEQTPFTNHEIQLQKGDNIYIFSDGYQDQFGGPRGKKFMSKQFRQLFIDIQTMNMEEQKEHLDKTIEEWKEGREQVDDILVIGIRV